MREPRWNKTDKLEGDKLKSRIQNLTYLDVNIYSMLFLLIKKKKKIFGFGRFEALVKGLFGCDDVKNVF